jgi:hypothetical protein
VHDFDKPLIVGDDLRSINQAEVSLHQQTIATSFDDDNFPPSEPFRGILDSSTSDQPVAPSLFESPSNDQFISLPDALETLNDDIGFSNHFVGQSEPVSDNACSWGAPHAKGKQPEMDLPLPVPPGAMNTSQSGEAMLEEDIDIDAFNGSEATRDSYHRLLEMNTNPNSLLAMDIAGTQMDIDELVLNSEIIWEDLVFEPASSSTMAENTVLEGYGPNKLNRTTGLERHYELLERISDVQHPHQKLHGGQLLRLGTGVAEALLGTQFDPLVRGFGEEIGEVECIPEHLLDIFADIKKWENILEGEHEGTKRLREYIRDCSFDIRMDQDGDFVIVGLEQLKTLIRRVTQFLRVLVAQLPPKPPAASTVLARTRADASNLRLQGDQGDNNDQEGSGDRHSGITILSLRTLPKSLPRNALTLTQSLRQYPCHFCSADRLRQVCSPTRRLLFIRLHLIFPFPTF